MVVYLGYIAAAYLDREKSETATLTTNSLPSNAPCIKPP